MIGSPIREQMWLRITIQSGIDVPSTLNGLLVGAATTDIPVLREREFLTGANCRAPQVEKAMAAHVVDELVPLGIAVCRQGCPLSLPPRTPRVPRTLS